MKSIVQLSIVFLLSLLFATSLYSQSLPDTTKKSQPVIVKMKNGDEFKGVILKKDDQTITLKTNNGELNLISSNVKSIEMNEYKGRFRFSNSHDTRYFFGPTAIPIKKHKGYYQNVLLTTNFVNFGISKNISIGGGFEFISTILGYPIWFLTPKIGFDLSENLHAGGGIIMAGFAAEGTASLGYGVATLGNSESNLTLGAGYGFFSGELSKNPAIMLSGTHRLSSGVALLSENYFIPVKNDVSYFSIQGIRLMSPKNSFDIGLIFIPSISEFIPAIPFVGYARAF